MKFKLFFTLFLLQITLFSALAQTDKEKAVLQFVKSAGLEHASIGLVVKDFSGKVIVSHNKEKSYTPASILKIVTTATAMEVLGADYRFKTILAKDANKANRLLIHGYGDPTLGTEYLDNSPHEFTNVWANEIEKAFADKKELDITVIDNYFGYRGVSRKWVHEDLGNYYAAAAYGISVFDNTYRLSLDTKQGAAPKIIGTEPKMKDLKFNNTLSVNTTGEDNGYILGGTFSNERTIIGDVPANRSKFMIKGDIPNPGLFLGQTIGDVLLTRNIKVNKIETTYEMYGKDMYSNSPAIYYEKIFYIHQSPILADIAKDINMRSNNHYAEHLIRSIGRVQNSNIYSFALEEGVKKIETLWAINGLGANNLFMYDGCGLAPSNAVSADFMSDVLVYMQTKSANAVPFLNSLPKAGKEGTVKNFLKGTRLEGKVFAKSGSIANVQCFAGYYIDGNKKYAFTIMVNKYNGSRSQIVRAIERLLLGVL